MLSVYVCLYLPAVLAMCPLCFSASVCPSLRSVPHTRVCWGADTGHRHVIYSVNIYTTLSLHYTTLPFFFFFRNCVNYIVYLFMIEYDPEYHTSSIVDILYIHMLKDHKSCACVCTIWAVVVSSSSFHILLGSHRLLPLWCYCSGPFQCKQ